MSAAHVHMDQGVTYLGMGNLPTSSHIAKGSNSSSLGSHQCQYLLR